MGESETRLRQMCQAQLEGIRIQVPFTIETFCEALSAKRGRKIVLRELPDYGDPNAPCGLWVAYPDEDHIWYAAAASQRHRIQVIMHEIAHMLLEHNLHNGVAALLAALPPEIATARVRKIFGRTKYSTDQEHDAELAASVLDEIIEDLPTVQTHSRHGVLDRVDATMIHPRRNRR